MKKKTSNLTVICLLVVIVVYLILNPKDVRESISFGVSILTDNLFPTLFPFFVVSNLLISFGFINILSKIFSRVMKFFKMPASASFPLVISLFSGFPSGAKYTTRLAMDGLISTKQANILLTFTHFSNPLFVFGFIGSIIFNNSLIALIILIANIGSGLLVGYIFTRKLEYDNNFNMYNENSNSSFGEEFAKAIMDALNTLFLLLGIVVLFIIFNTIVTDFLSLNDFSRSILSGILEMTIGIKYVSYLDISLIFKVLLTTFFISFGGISVHMQVLSIISLAKLKYKYFFFARILHGLLAMILVFILFIILII